MPFEYGSSDIGIKNPYSVEGQIRAVGGILVAGVGALLLLNVAGTVASEGRESGVFQLCIALLLCGGGLAIASRAAVQAFRFHDGRTAPADLAAKKRANRLNVPLGTRAYSAADIADMLISRKNVTFRAPSGWLPTVFPQLLFLPPVYRALAEDLLCAARGEASPDAACCNPRSATRIARPGRSESPPWLKTPPYCTRTAGQAGSGSAG